MEKLILDTQWLEGRAEHTVSKNLVMQILKWLC